jgi:transcriptional regulator with XRE-family HTH domain
MLLSTLLRSLRERQRLRVADVCALLECSPSAVYAWEAGQKEPGAAHLSALANAYSATKKDRAELARLRAFGPDEVTGE